MGHSPCTHGSQSDGGGRHRDSLRREWAPGEAQNEAFVEHKRRVVNSVQWVEEGIKASELSLERKV